jgi:hypothetical protein
MEDPEISPHSYSHLISTKVPKTYTGEKQPFNKRCWKNWITKVKTRSLPFTLYKNHLKIDHFKICNFESVRGTHKENTLRSRHRQWFSE